MTRTATTETQARPKSGTWNIDPAHSGVGFVVRHLMVSKVRGRFGIFEGKIEIGETPQDTQVEARIDASSIDTAMPARDEHLRSPDFLDVATFPALTFRSTSVEVLDDTSLRLTGELTIRDVTRPVTLDVTYEGIASFGGERAAFSAAGEIDREEFGVTWNQAMEAGGVIVGKRVRIELEIEAVLAA